MERIVWTDDMLEYLRKHFPTEPAGDIAEALGVSDTTIRLKARALGIEKSKDFKTKDYMYRIVKNYKNRYRVKS